MDHLVDLISNIDLQVINGDKVLEVRNAGIDKGAATMRILSGMSKKPGFILAIGDGQTDEDMFRVIPKEAHSIKSRFAFVLCKI